MDLRLVVIVLGFGVVAAAGAWQGVARLDRFLRVAGAPSPRPWAATAQEADVPAFSMERWRQLRAGADAADGRPLIEGLDPPTAGALIPLERVHDVVIERVSLD